MRRDAVLTDEAYSLSIAHLLQHYRRDITQEDLCFALWRPSTGRDRLTALIDEVILPQEGDRLLHGNASFTPDYMARSIWLARRKNAGLAFMHSHPTSGWQGMSRADVEAERDVLAYPARATGLPLVGLTIGQDGYWSARFWEKDGSEMRRRWCDKIRLVRPNTYGLHFNDELIPPPKRRDILRRTFDTWGREMQDNISRLHVGVVGLGSVGCLVAEAVARLGIARVTLIDPDRIEEHNLDRLLYGTIREVGQLKVDVAARAMRAHSTAEEFAVMTYPLSVQERLAYDAVLDCDIIFSCVDRPVPRDVLNYVAQAHLIPVIDGGIAVEVDNDKRLFSAHWRSYVVTPYTQCLRCSGQYNSSQVIVELDGSLDNPSYVKNLPSASQLGNENVFPFSQSVAAQDVNLMLRYMNARDWWPSVQAQDYQFITGETTILDTDCFAGCSFVQRHAQGDAEKPFYIGDREPRLPGRRKPSNLRRLSRNLGRLFWSH